MWKISQTFEPFDGMIGFKDSHIFVGPKLPPFGFNGWSPRGAPRKTSRPRKEATVGESGKTKPRADLQNQHKQNSKSRLLSLPWQWRSTETSPGNFIWSCQCLDVGKAIDMSSKCRVFFTGDKKPGIFLPIFSGNVLRMLSVFLFRLLVVLAGILKSSTEVSILGIRVTPSRDAIRA